MIRSKTGFAKKIFLQLNMCCLHSVRNLRNFSLSFSREQPPRGRGRFSIALAVCMLMKDGDSILSDLLSESTAKALDRIEILQHPFKQRTKNNGSNIQDQKIRLRKQEEGWYYICGNERSAAYVQTFSYHNSVPRVSQ